MTLKSRSLLFSWVLYFFKYCYVHSKGNYMAFLLQELKCWGLPLWQKYVPANWTGFNHFPPPILNYLPAILFLLLLFKFCRYIGCRNRWRWQVSQNRTIIVHGKAPWLSCLLSPEEPLLVPLFQCKESSSGVIRWGSRSFFFPWDSSASPALPHCTSLVCWHEHPLLYQKKMHAFIQTLWDCIARWWEIWVCYHPGCIQQQNLELNIPLSLIPIANPCSVLQPLAPEVAQPLPIPHYKG